MEVPPRRRVSRQRHVEDVGGEQPVELLALELGAPGSDRLLETTPQRVQRLPGLPVADLAQRLRQLGVPAEEANAHGLQLVRRRRGRDRAFRLAFEHPGVHPRETTIVPIDPYQPIAGLYDTWSRTVVEDVDFYVEEAVAAGGPVVELGVGTGRIAIPTALAGVRVIGVDFLAPRCSRCAADGPEAGGRRRPPRPSTRRLLGAAGDRAGPARHLSVPLVPPPARPTSSDSAHCGRVRAARARSGRLVFDVFAPSPAGHSRHPRALDRAGAGDLGAGRLVPGNPPSSTSPFEARAGRPR